MNQRTTSTDTPPDLGEPEYVQDTDPLDDDRDQENPCEYSEGHDFSNHDFDNDPDWR